MKVTLSDSTGFTKLADIINSAKTTAKKEFEIELNPPNDHEFAFLNGVFKGSLLNISGVLKLTADYNGQLITICARCLNEVVYPLSFNVSEVFNIETLSTEASSDNLEALIIEAYSFSLPQRFLCSENCKGLCINCGGNLNDGKCSCRASKNSIFDQIIIDEGVVKNGSS